MNRPSSHHDGLLDGATLLDDALDALARGDRAVFDRLDPETRDTFGQLGEWAALGGFDGFELVLAPPAPAQPNGSTWTQPERKLPVHATASAAIPATRPTPRLVPHAPRLWSAVAWLAIAAILAASVYGLVPRLGDDGEPNPTNPAFQPAATLSATPSPLFPASCPVTMPNGVDPANVEPPGHWYGKDGLYVGVPVDGIYHAKTEPGQQGGWNKHIWVRDVGQVPLTVEVIPYGEPESGEAGRAEPDPGSYVMEIWFPEEGCWTITGTTPQTTISVTVWVVFVDSWLATPEASPQPAVAADVVNYGGGAGHPWYLSDDQPVLGEEPFTFTIDGERRDVISPPLVVGDSMILTTMDATSSDANWQTIRYNLATGEVMWTSPVPILGPFATDGMYVYGSALDLVSESGLYVPVVIRLDTGEMQTGVGDWLGSADIPEGPVTVGTAGYYTTVDGVAAPVSPGGPADFWVSREEWTYSNASQIDPGYVGGHSTTGIAASDDAIFVLRPSRTIVKLDRETGEELGSINVVDAIRGDVSDVDIQVSGQRLVVTAYHANRPAGSGTMPASILVYHTSNLSFIVRADVPDLRSNLAIDTNWIYFAGRLDGDEELRIYRIHPSGGSLGTPISDFSAPIEESVGLSLSGSTLMVIGPPATYAFIDVEQETVIQAGDVRLPEGESLMVFPIQLWGDVPVTISDTGTVVVFGEAP